ncbi:MAG: GGDEF domain-containing protein [Oscillospiraceae bacterium]|nr:GGDEF domain-containing protein [Oscillospiraceae bacterium]
MLHPIIGVCLSTVQEEDRLYFISGLNRHAVENGYRLMIFQTCSDLYRSKNPNDDGEITVFQLIPYEKLSAMIILPQFLFNHPVLDTIVAECRKRDIPVISIDRQIFGCTCFSFAYADIFEQLCRHVIDVHRAKNLLMMAGTKGNSFSESRISAFRKALEESGLRFDESMVGYGDFWAEPTEATMERWFEIEKRPYPDAIICANDSMAIVVSSWLQLRGVRIPEDVIITGFDGIQQSEYHLPHLTTCHQDYDRMGRELVAAVNRLRRGERQPVYNVIGFHIRLSQSCGCKPVEFRNINDAMNRLFQRVRTVNNRQDLMCTLQASISKMETIEELPSVLIEKFVFHTSIFAINDDIFKLPDFGRHHKKDKAFTENADIMYHRYFWYQRERCTVPRRELIPDLDRMLEREEPIIVCVLHHLDLTLGYCVFQTELAVEEYEKIYTFMSAVNASFGAFHSKLQIQAINDQLKSVNTELEKLYVHDYLTGLYNRRGFYREFRLMREAQKTPAFAFLISADLDRLKYINDTFGHLEGDNAICTVAQALLHAAGKDDIVARFGGDEFAVGGILPAADAEAHYAAFREHFQNYLKKYNEISQNPYPVEASIGFYAEALNSDFDLDSMIKVADDRMYAEKLAHKKARLV